MAYFDFNYENWTPTLIVLAALLKRLGIWSPSLPEPIVQMWKLHKNSNFPALEEVIATSLATCSHFNECFIVLDALDECSDENWNDMLRVLRAFEASPCKVLLSLRDDDVDDYHIRNL